MLFTMHRENFDLYHKEFCTTLQGRQKRTYKKRKTKKRTPKKKTAAQSKSQLRSKLDILAEQRQTGNDSAPKSAPSPSTSKQETEHSLFEPSTKPSSVESPVTVRDVVLDPVQSGTTDESVIVDPVEDKSVELEQSEIVNDHFLPLPAHGVPKNTKKKSGPFRQKALNVVHNQIVGLEVKFQRDVFELEGIYTEKYYKPLLELRRKLLEYRPGISTYSIKRWEEFVNSCSAAFPPDSKTLDRLHTNINDMLFQTDTHSESYDSYWLTVLLNSGSFISNLVRNKDLEKLKYITEIKSLPLEVFRKDECCEGAAESGIGFEIRFEFRPNPYFTNRALYKRYVIDVLPSSLDYVTTSRDKRLLSDDDINECDADGEGSDNEAETKIRTRKNETLLDYKGPRVVSIKGCTINWTLSECDSSSISETTSNSEVPKRSFFNYFTMEWDNNFAENCYTTSEVLRDYEIGTYFRDVLIPRSYAFYRQNKTTEKYNTNASSTNGTCTEISTPLTKETSATTLPTSLRSEQTASIFNKNRPNNHPPSHKLGSTKDNTTYYTAESTHLKPTRGIDNNKNSSYVTANENNKDLNKSKFKKVFPKTSARQRKPNYKVSFSSDLNKNYDEIDDEVVLRRTSIPKPNLRCDVDDFVEIPRKSVAPSAGVNNPFLRGSHTYDFDVFPPVNRMPKEGNCCKNKDDIISVEHSRQKMANVVNKVNKLLKYSDRVEFPSIPVNEVLKQDAKERAMEEAMILNHINRCNEESDVGFSDGVASLKGDEADDEDNWSDIHPPSVNRAFERIKYEMKTGATLRKRKCCLASNYDETTDSLLSSKPSDDVADIKRIRYRDVSAYPIGENPVDDSDDVVSSKDGDTTCTSDDCCEKVRRGLPTPTTTDSEGSDQTRINLERIKKKNAINVAPLVSAGVQKSARPPDTDSEAPPTPKGGETPNNCKQQ